MPGMPCPALASVVPKVKVSAAASISMGRIDFTFSNCYLAAVQMDTQAEFTFHPPFPRHGVMERTRNTALNHISLVDLSVCALARY